MYYRTEEEMKQTWCPKVRLTMDEFGRLFTNRVEQACYYANTRCLGANCALWEWDNAITDGPRKGCCGLGR